jgi:fumarylpyruvate hydrolase
MPDAVSPADLLFPLPRLPLATVAGEAKVFPVHRIFCVGRNYADHAKEMGFEPDRQEPFYFLKPATALTPSGATVPYPPGTANYHHEMEFVVALGGPAWFSSEERAMDAVFGYAAGLDMTRRDLQLAARDKGRPWDLGKAFEQSAILAPIVRKAAFGPIGDQRIALSVNGTARQDARLSDLIWRVPELIAHLSRYYHLGPGDLIYTGTPAGVGAVEPGDRLVGAIEGLPDVELTIGEPEPH